MQIFLPCLYALLGCVGYCLIFNIRSRKIFIAAAISGAIGWGVYLMFGFLKNDITQSFFAIMAVAIYSEIMARIHKSPVTVYLIIGLIPLVPGGGIYYTMEHCINGDTMSFLNTGLHTFGIAGALALGILLVSACVRLMHNILHHGKNEDAFRRS